MEDKFIFPAIRFRELMQSYNLMFKPHPLSLEVASPRDRAFKAQAIYAEVRDFYSKVITDLLKAIEPADKNSVFMLSELLKIKEMVEDMHKCWTTPVYAVNPDVEIPPETMAPGKLFYRKENKDGDQRANSNQHVDNTD